VGEKFQLSGRWVAKKPLTAKIAKKTRKEREENQEEENQERIKNRRFPRFPLHLSVLVVVPSYIL
jgi:hypothetical protein